MKTRFLYRLLPLLFFSFVTVTPPDVTGSWLMTAHLVSPAKDGISDIYTHFKDLYGGCREDMGLTLNTDGTLKFTPVKGCQNPLGNVIMKAATKFMPSGKASWKSTENKIQLEDGKGKTQEYDLQVDGTSMKWGFDETSQQTTVRHTIEFKRN